MTLPLDSNPGNGPATTLEGVLERVVFANEENAWSVVRIAVPGHRAECFAPGVLERLERLRLEHDPEARFALPDPAAME